MDASLLVMPSNPSQFSVDSVRVVKILGGSIHETKVVKGMVLGREPEGTITKATNARVAVFSCPLDLAQTETKGTVLIKNAKELVGFNRGEEERMEEEFKEIKKTGVNVLVTGGTVGDLSLHFLNKLGFLVVKVPSKFDLRRLCRVVGATAITRLVSE